MSEEDEIRDLWGWSIRTYGSEHTHDFECRTWRGQNLFGDCNCSHQNPTTQENIR